MTRLFRQDNNYDTSPTFTFWNGCISESYRLESLIPQNIRATLEHFDKKKKHSRSCAIVLIHLNDRTLLKKNLDIVFPVNNDYILFFSEQRSTYSLGYLRDSTGVFMCPSDELICPIAGMVCRMIPR